MLNDKQRLATEERCPMLIVSAAPGSGKTRVLVERVKRLMEPQNSVVISFTNAAADEIRTRLIRDGFDYGQLRYLGTLHSWAITEMTKQGVNQTILGDNEKTEAISTVVETLGAMARNLSKTEIWKLAMNPPRFGSGKSIGTAVRKWFHKKKSTHLDFVLMDFLNMSKSGLIEIPDQIMVDEFQDSSEMDSEIYNRFHSLGTSLFLIGDPRQSIFGFRGARPDIMLGMATTETSKVFQMNENYRSTPTICKYASKIGRLMTWLEDLSSEIIPINRDDKHSIIVHQFDTAEEESLKVSEIVPTITGTVAILCRYNDQVKDVAGVLRAKGIRLSASTDSEIEAESESWISKIAETLDSSLSIDLNESKWKDVLIKIGVPFDTQSKLIPRLIHCRNTADIAGLATEDAPSDETIFVGTIHSSKGREFDNVWIVGCDDVTFTGADQETLRLFFVAITRARSTLNLSFAKSRQQAGSGKRIAVGKSELLP